MKYFPNSTSNPYTTNPFIKGTFVATMMIGEGISKYIVKNMGRSIGSSIARYTIKKKEIDNLNKQINLLKKELNNKNNKNNTYYKIFLDSIHKINGNFQKIIPSSYNNIPPNFINIHSALSVIGGGGAIYGLYHYIQKKNKAKKLQSKPQTNKNI